MGDIRCLPDLLNSYQTCCSEEGETLDIIDFLTDHLLNLDDNDSNIGERPHLPPLFMVFPLQQTAEWVQNDIVISIGESFKKKKIHFLEKPYAFNFKQWTLDPPEFIISTSLKHPLIKF